MHTCRWIPETGPGIEHLVLRRDGEAIVAEGAVVGDRFGDGFGAFYSIRCDALWRVRHAVVEVAGHGRIELIADGAGAWQDGEGAPIPALAGCIDIDLTASCFTNTLPIRRLGDALAARQAIDVAYVWIPELRVETARQAYTRLGANLVRFESVGSDFRADLQVDDEGRVVRYPGLFRRTN
jgi:hypothetical protein